jgi:hypothetical protein
MPSLKGNRREFMALAAQLGLAAALPACVAGTESTNDPSGLETRDGGSLLERLRDILNQAICTGDRDELLAQAKSLRLAPAQMQMLAGISVADLEVMRAASRRVYVLQPPAAAAGSVPAVA